LVSIKAVIFDLDDTLLDSSSLRGARDRQEWRAVLSALDSVEPFEIAEEEVEVTMLPAEVRSRGMAVGLLTHSPENYAEALLKRHAIKVEAMVTGSDRFPNKPDPGGLLAVASGLGVEPGGCAYVGDAVGDFGAAAAAGMVSIGVSWSGLAPDSWRHGWPDIAVNRPARLLEYLDGEVGLGPLGEALAAGEEATGHWGSLLQLGANTFGLGRYFPTTDRRHPAAPLSRLIIDSKEATSGQERLGACFEGLAAVNITNPPDLVVSVPPDPEGVDRFAPARAAVAGLYEAEDGGGVLRQLYGVEDYKSTRRDDRAAKVVDRFEVSEPVEGRRIVLLDDVLTSGAQAEACRVALREAGSGGVSIIVAGVAQDRLPDPCPECEIGTVRTKRRGSDGHEFLGCTRWPACWWSEDLPD
jgi:HAD superfamily hydrolase (TIGR01549 family)